MTEQNVPARFRYVTTRTRHNCEGCQRRILPKTRVLNVSGRVTGYWFNNYFCSSCDLDRIASIPDSDLREKMRRARIAKIVAKENQGK